MASLFRGVATLKESMCGVAPDCKWDGTTRTCVADVAESTYVCSELTIEGCTNHDECEFDQIANKCTQQAEERNDEPGGAFCRSKK
jgi:hypothetical protein